MVNLHKTRAATVHDRMDQEPSVLVPTIDEIRTAGELTRKYPELIGRLLLDLDHVELQQVIKGFVNAGGDLATISYVTEDNSGENDDWYDPLAGLGLGCDSIPADGWPDSIKPEVINRILNQMPYED